MQINAIIDTLQKFQEISGLAVNLTKTKIAPFGKCIRLHYLEEETGLTAVNSFKLLGCIFDSELENFAVNYTKAITAMRKQIFIWSTRKLD